MKKIMNLMVCALLLSMSGDLFSVSRKKSTNAVVPKSQKVSRAGSSVLTNPNQQGHNLNNVRVQSTFAGTAINKVHTPKGGNKTGCIGCSGWGSDGSSQRQTNAG